MQYSQLVAPNQVMIECIINSQGGETIAQNPFNEQDYLIGRPIVAIQTFSSTDIRVSPLGQKLPVIPDEIFPYAFLNIQRAGMGPIKAGQWYKWLPLCSLRNLYNAQAGLSANLDIFRCDPMTIQWRDTNVAFPTPATQTTAYSVPFLITFLLPEQDPREYTMAFLKR